MPTGHTEPPDPDVLLATARIRAAPATHTPAAAARATADTGAAAGESVPAGRAAPSAADPCADAAEVPSREASCDEPPTTPGDAAHGAPGDAAHGADAPVCPTAGRATDPTRILFTTEGPALIAGPVELVAADGTVLRSDRFLVALCQCKRSRTYPLCDTSHRRRPRGSRS